jgi:hypothetical protein
MDVPHNQWMSLFEGLYPVSEKVDGIVLALKANKSTLALISVLILSFHKNSEIDKLKKQGVVRHQICLNFL